MTPQDSVIEMLVCIDTELFMHPKDDEPLKVNVQLTTRSGKCYCEPMQVSTSSGNSSIVDWFERDVGIQFIGSFINAQVSVDKSGRLTLYYDSRYSFDCFFTTDMIDEQFQQSSTTKQNDKLSDANKENVQQKLKHSDKQNKPTAEGSGGSPDRLILDNRELKRAEHLAARFFGTRRLPSQFRRRDALLVRVHTKAIRRWLSRGWEIFTRNISERERVNSKLIEMLQRRMLRSRSLRLTRLTFVSWVSYTKQAITTRSALRKCLISKERRMKQSAVGVWYGETMKANFLMLLQETATPTSPCPEFRGRSPSTSSGILDAVMRSSPRPPGGQTPVQRTNAASTPSRHVFAAFPSGYTPTPPTGPRSRRGTPGSSHTGYSRRSMGRSPRNQFPATPGRRRSENQMRTSRGRPRRSQSLNSRPSSLEPTSRDAEYLHEQQTPEVLHFVPSTPSQPMSPFIIQESRIIDYDSDEMTMHHVHHVHHYSQEGDGGSPSVHPQQYWSPTAPTIGRKYSFPRQQQRNTLGASKGSETPDVRHQQWFPQGFTTGHEGYSQPKRRQSDTPQLYQVPSDTGSANYRQWSPGTANVGNTTPEVCGNKGFPLNGNDTPMSAYQQEPSAQQTFPIGVPSQFPHDARHARPGTDSGFGTVSSPPHLVPVGESAFKGAAEHIQGGVSPAMRRMANGISMARPTSGWRSKRVVREASATVHTSTPLSFLQQSNTPRSASSLQHTEDHNALAAWRKQAESQISRPYFSEQPSPAATFPAASESVRKVSIGYTPCQLKNLDNVSRSNKEGDRFHEQENSSPYGSQYSRNSNIPIEKSPYIGGHSKARGASCGSDSTSPQKVANLFQTGNGDVSIEQNQGRYPVPPDQSTRASFNQPFQYQRRDSYGSQFLSAGHSVLSTPAKHPLSQPHWADVPDMLRCIGLEQYCSNFVEEEFTDLSLLIQLSKEKKSDFMDTMREIGVSKVGHRERILQALKAFHAPSPFAQSDAFSPSCDSPFDPNGSFRNQPPRGRFESFSGQSVASGKPLTSQSPLSDISNLDLSHNKTPRKLSGTVKAQVLVQSRTRRGNAPEYATMLVTDSQSSRPRSQSLNSPQVKARDGAQGLRSSTSSLPPLPPPPPVHGDEGQKAHGEDGNDVSNQQDEVPNQEKLYQYTETASRLAKMAIASK